MKSSAANKCLVVVNVASVWVIQQEVTGFTDGNYDLTRVIFIFIA